VDIDHRFWYQVYYERRRGYVITTYQQRLRLSSFHCWFCIGRLHARPKPKNSFRALSSRSACALGFDLPVDCNFCTLLASTYQGKFNDFFLYGWPLVNCLFVGISEELMFRGVLLSSLVRIYRFWRAAIILSLMFGMVHVLNGFITGLFFESFVQAILATFSGFIFLAIRVKTKSIVLAIAIHWLWDFSVFMSATNPHAGGKIIEMMVSIVLAASPLAFGILGIAQLRNRKVVEDFLAEQPESISY